MLNAGLGFSDEFEMEVCNYNEKSNNRIKEQYKEWLFTIKREGTAFFKTVKNVVSCNFKFCIIGDVIDFVIVQFTYLPILLYTNKILNLQIITSVQLILKIKTILLVL